MTIALMPSAYAPHVGGVEEYTRQLARRYQNRGLGVIVITNRWPQDLPAHERIDGVDVYRLPFRVPIGCWKARTKYAVTHAWILGQCTRLLRRHEVDVVHLHCASTNSLYAMEASDALGLPLVVTSHAEHSVDTTGIFKKWPYMRGLLASLLQRADAVTACSEHTLRDLERFCDLNLDDKGLCVRNGVDVAEFAEVAPHVCDRPYLLAVGRLTEQKGFDVLLDALASVDLRDHVLLLAGDGPDRAALEEQSSRLGLTDRVRFLGKTDRSTTLSLHAGAKFVVLSSRREGLPLVILEAMAAGRAVVATDVGGVGEAVVDGGTGHVVPAESPAALARAIQQLIDDPHTRDRFGAAARARVEAFDWKTIIDTYLRVYRQCRTVTAQRESHAEAAHA